MTVAQLTETQRAALDAIAKSDTGRMVVGKNTRVRLDTAMDLERLGFVELTAPTLAYSRAGQAKARVTIPGRRAWLNQGEAA